MTEIVDPILAINPPSADTQPPKKRGRPPGSKNKTAKKIPSDYSPEVQLQIHESLMMGFGALTMFMAVHLRPTRDELEMVLLPAERIVLRRTGELGDINPDVYDCIQIGLGMLLYGARIVTNAPKNAPTPRAVTPTPHTGGMAQTSSNQQTPNPAESNGFASIDSKLADLYQAASRTPSQ